MSIDNQSWQQEFRDMMFGDLKVIKFILDEHPESWGVDVAPIPKWGEILERFARRNEYQMTRREWDILFRQVQKLTLRLREINGTPEQQRAVWNEYQLRLKKRASEAEVIP